MESLMIILLYLILECSGQDCQSKLGSCVITPDSSRACVGYKEKVSESTNYIGIMWDLTVDLELDAEEAECYCNSAFGTSLATILDEDDQTEMEQLLDIQYSRRRDGFWPGKTARVWVGWSNDDIDNGNSAWKPCLPSQCANGDTCSANNAKSASWHSSLDGDDELFYRRRCGTMYLARQADTGKWDAVSCYGKKDFVCNHSDGKYGSPMSCTVPTDQSTNHPTDNPTTKQPTGSPTDNPTTKQPTDSPIDNPTDSPTTESPTPQPTCTPVPVPCRNIVPTLQPTPTLTYVFGFMTCGTKNGWSRNPFTIDWFWGYKHWRCVITPLTISTVWLCHSDNAEMCSDSSQLTYAVQFSNPSSDHVCVDSIQYPTDTYGNYATANVNDELVGDDGYYYRYYNLVSPSAVPSPVYGSERSSMPVCNSNGNQKVILLGELPKVNIDGYNFNLIYVVLISTLANIFIFFITYQLCIKPKFKRNLHAFDKVTTDEEEALNA